MAGNHVASPFDPWFQSRRSFRPDWRLKRLKKLFGAVVYGEIVPERGRWLETYAKRE